MRWIDRRRRAVCAAGALLAAVPFVARAQSSLLLQGIADGEAWSTNTTSSLLTRNNGNPGVVGRLQVWSAIEPVSHVVLYGQVEGAGGPARSREEYGVRSNQFGVRYVGSRAFTADVGRLVPVIGTFAARRFSTRNPLIGQPDGYSLEYPYGAELSGEFTHFDYRAAMVSLPTSHDGYQPEPTPRLRPAIGGGFTPMVGLRFGGSFTVGSYLNRAIAPAYLAGRTWSDYRQRVLAGDLEFARGYLETHAEIARGSFDVPGRAAIAGLTYYGEAKYTFTPRVFVAGRAERNDYPFIRPQGTSGWTAKLTDFVDGELGVGYRVTSNTLLKASIRGDRWWPHTTSYATGGHALAVQWSQAFDVMSWAGRED
ncbi:MAG TPA: hypothetical protein VHB25_08130 [Gemmatimonadaceae bacterium]|nr:hypothetical protein [Gemmatimonadaceae bacterium]